MSDQAQSPAELIRAHTFGRVTAKEVCNGIDGWASDVLVGGFINLHDCPPEIRALFDSIRFNVVWPEGLEMSVDADKKVKAFRKAASKAAKKAKKAGVENVAQPFSKLAYGAESTLVELGYCQLHASISIEGVKVEVHFWGRPSPTMGWKTSPHPFFIKVKIDTEEQLALFT